eukprot:scaffold146778_cov19-Tisochrysis_lutea.AAC.1
MGSRDEPGNIRMLKGWSDMACSAGCTQIAVCAKACFAASGGSLRGPGGVQQCGVGAGFPLSRHEAHQGGCHAGTRLAVRVPGECDW